MKKVLRMFGMAFCFALALSLTLMPTASFAAPPGPSESTYVGYSYLYGGTHTISNNGDLTVAINVTTEAKSVVDELGATVMLQEWTGTAWVDKGTATTVKSTNTLSFAGTVNKTVRAGYYYQARVVHYAKKNGVTESVTEYTDSKLV